MSSNANSKPMVTDVFVKGAVHGWQIATSSTIPNVLMAFVIIKILKHSGLLDIIGQVFDPSDGSLRSSWSGCHDSLGRMDVHGWWRWRGCCLVR